MDFGFTMLLKQWIKKKKNKMRQFWVKKTEGKQNSVTIMISADGKGTFSSELAIRTGIVLIKMLKKRIENRSNAFNWDKLPD